MKQKRFKKLLMAHGTDRNTARGLAECINAAQRTGFIERFTIKFVNGQGVSGRECALLPRGL